MTKQQLIDLSNAKIADESGIVASEHREVNDAIIGGLYPTPIEQTPLSTEIITPIGANVGFRLNFSKMGRRCFIDGFITNNTGAPLTFPEIALFADGEYLPMEDAVFKFIAVYGFTGDTVTVKVQNGILSVEDVMPTGSFTLISASYNVND